jgi:Mg-chelatase subunit ChlD
MIKSFHQNQSGSVALIFGLGFATIMACCGAALDFARASNTRTALQAALDASLLSAGKKSLATGLRADRNEVVAMMKSNLPSSLQPMADSLQITQTDTKLSGQVAGTVRNQFASFIGLDATNVAASASIPMGSTRLEVALVLDSTGSMGQLGKMDALKVSANLLIDTLMSTRQAGTEIAIGIVPFATQVRIDTALAGAGWLALRSGQPIPEENTAIGTWDGCVMDRDMPLNSKRDLPTKPEDAYPAQNCMFPNLQRILPLTTDMTQVRSRISALTPDGTTNTTIGLAWGYNILNPAAPMGGGAAPATRKPIRVLVFLTDGLNTRDRFNQAPAQMDNDMRNLCRESKLTDVRVFTIRVIEGNDALLRDCASDPADFYTTNDSTGLVAVFRSIALKLATLRLSS